MNLRNKYNAEGFLDISFLVAAILLVIHYFLVTNNNLMMSSYLLLAVLSSYLFMKKEILGKIVSAIYFIYFSFAISFMLLEGRIHPMTHYLLILGNFFFIIYSLSILINIKKKGESVLTFLMLFILAFVNLILIVFKLYTTLTYGTIVFIILFLIHLLVKKEEAMRIGYLVGYQYLIFFLNQVKG